MGCVELTGPGLYINIWGRGTFDIKLGPVTLTQELAVAEIDDEILLGDDLLRRDILNSRNVIVYCLRDMRFHCKLWDFPSRLLRYLY